MSDGKPNMPIDDWLEIIRLFDGLRAYQTQATEAIHGIQMRLDDSEDELNLKQEIFKREMQAQMQFVGRNVEEIAGKLESHLGSHKMRDRESEARILEIQRTRIQSRWEFWKVIVAAVIGGIATLATAAISGLFK